jgi:hypothetical protein
MSELTGNERLEQEIAAIDDRLFQWQPGEDRKAAFDSLIGDDGRYHCPWPNCGDTSPAPQGMARHMAYHHAWVSPWRHEHSRRKATPKATKRQAYPSEVARKEKIKCPAPGCGREINRPYLRAHLRDFHRFNGTKIKRLLEVEAIAPSEQKPLTAQEICQTVLLEVAPNGSIPVDAIPAYNEWVYATEMFLGRLMS